MSDQENSPVSYNENMQFDDSSRPDVEENKTDANDADRENDSEDNIETA